MAGDLEPVFEEAGRAWNVDPNLLRAVASGESGGQGDRATSYKGAEGRMQLMPDTARRLGVTNTRDPVQSIFGAAKLLSSHLEETNGDVTTALRLYQGGPDRRGWGPQNAAYPGYIAQHYQKVMAGRQPGGAGAAPGGDPAAARDAIIDGAISRARQGQGAPAADASDDDLARALTTGGGSASGAPTAEASDDDLAKQLTAGAGGQQPAPARPDPYGPSIAEVQPMMQQGLEAARARDAAKPAEQQVREFLAPQPGTEYGSVLPLARDPGGQIRLALPGGLRNMASGLVDASQGPATGQVTPEATNALLGFATGGMGASVARGTGAAIGNRLLSPGAAGLGRSEVPDFIGPGLRAGAVDNRLLSAAAVAPPPVPPPAAAPAAAGPTVATSAPPPAMMPILTAGQASARVNKLLDHFSQGGPVQPGAQIVPGSAPTLAQSTGNAGLAALERGLQSSDPHFANLLTQRAATNGDARAGALLNVTGTPADVAAAETAREAATRAARDAAFANSRPVDPAPVVEQINSILAGPDGKRDAVARSLKPILDKLKAADGSGLENDPQQLYGVRKAINDLLGSRGTQEASDARAATRQLLEVKDALDGVIERGAPGFASYIQQYSEMSRPIDGMRYLQSRDLVNATGQMSLAKVDAFIKATEKQRSLPGARTADSVTDDQLAGLRYLRDDMQREARVNATKPLGSPTMQNFATNRLMAGINGGLDGTAVAAAGVLGPFAAAPVMGLRYLARAAGSRGERLVQEELRNRLLNPPSAAP